MSSKYALPVHVQISEMLIREIQAGRLVDGQRLEPERIMAQRYGIAVGTLRKALANLTEKGMLVRIQGSGNYVRARSDVESIYSFYRVELLQGGGLPTAEILSVERMDKPDHLPQFGKSQRAHRIRRIRRLAGTPAVLEEIWLDDSYAPRLDTKTMSESLYLYYREKLGLWITGAEDNLTAAALPDWSPQDFALPPGSPALLVTRHSVSRDGEVAEVSQNWINTNVAKYVARMA